ncbi:MAG: hypothetical protein MHPSP_003724 [Paramarteilia canceri]
MAINNYNAVLATSSLNRQQDIVKRADNNNYYVDAPDSKKFCPEDPLGLKRISPKCVFYNIFFTNKFLLRFLVPFLHGYIYLTFRSREKIPTAKLDHTDPLGLQRQPPLKKKRERPEFNKNGKRKTFRYGNYLNYYGYRLGKSMEDHRLQLIQSEWIDEKSILDVGCNSGCFTLDLALKFSPKYIVGIDIDQTLIEKAKLNKQKLIENVEKNSDNNISVVFPVSVQQSQRHVLIPKSPEYTRSDSVHFFCSNFFDIYQGNDNNATFDTIIAFSITKWIHLNWGDEGIVDFFERCYKMLNKSGVLLLEVQPFISYRKKRNIHPEIRANYDKIKLRPFDFESILAKQIGFDRVFEIKIAGSAESNGFERPLLVAKK